MVLGDKLKAAAIVVLLLAALAVFDYYGNFTGSKITGAVVVVDAGGGSGTSQTPAPPSSIPSYSVVVDPGLNILGFNTFDGFSGTNCSREQIYSSVQVYNPEKQGGEGYDVFEIDQSFRLIPHGIVVNPASAGWVYNYGGNCVIFSTLPSEGQLSLQRGWNMLSVPPRWVGGNDVVNHPGCNFGGGWLFYPERSENWDGKWAYFDKNTRFSDSDVGRGFWFYCG